jgi:DNA polymerase-3 subunit gamma/tau
MSTKLPDKRLSLAEKYRPKVFADLEGQDWARRALGGLILRGKLERHILLQGAHGSGKTSAAHIYARALRCLRIDPNGDGSPCLACDACNLPESDRMATFDVAGFGGTEEAVEDWVRPFRDGGGPKLLFFDECHALMKKAQDAILKFVEDPPPGIVTCFATTEPWRLQRTLRSRLMPVTVRSLGRGQALQLLERVATHEGITFEPEALTMLVGIKKGFPRDLIIGLEQVLDQSRHVSVESVRGNFDVDDIDHLIRYMEALISGSPQAQRDAFFDWRLPGHQKADWIRSYLISTYYNHVVGIDAIIEPMLHGDARCRVLYEKFKEKGLQAGHEPKKLWLRMQEFWLTDDSAIELKLSLFEELVNNALKTPAIRFQTLAPLVPSLGRAPAEADQAAVTEPTDFMDFDDVREILNRSSFFVQHSGLLMNAAMDIRPSHDLRTQGLAAANAIYDFVERVGRTISGHDSASVVVVERDESGIIGRSAWHVPGLDQRLAARLQLLCEEWSGGDGTSCVDVRTSLRAIDWKFHHESVLKLCAAFQEDMGTVQGEPLLKRLGVPRAWQRQPSVGGFRPRFFGGMMSSALHRASQLSMPFLSAVDDEAWSWVTKRWELQEYTARKRTIQERRSALEWYPGADQASQADRADLMANWPANARARERSWVGWWVSNVDA